MMTIAGYEFTATCVHDGAPLVPIAAGTTNGTQARAVAKCSRCETEFVLSVEMLIGRGRMPGRAR